MNHKTNTDFAKLFWPAIVHFCLGGDECTLMFLIHERSGGYGECEIIYEDEVAKKLQITRKKAIDMINGLIDRKFIQINEHKKWRQNADGSWQRPRYYWRMATSQQWKDFIASSK